MMSDETCKAAVPRLTQVVGAVLTCESHVVYIPEQRWKQQRRSTDAQRLNPMAGDQTLNAPDRSGNIRGVEVINEIH